MNVLDLSSVSEHKLLRILTSVRKEGWVLAYLSSEGQRVGRKTTASLSYSRSLHWQWASVICLDKKTRHADGFLPPNEQHPADDLTLGSLRTTAVGEGKCRTALCKPALPTSILSAAALRSAHPRLLSLRTGSPRRQSPRCLRKRTTRGLGYLG